MTCLTDFLKISDKLAILGYLPQRQRQLFGYRSRQKPVLHLEDFDITFKNDMKYLGVIIDSRWSFELHFF